MGLSKKDLIIVFVLALLFRLGFFFAFAIHLHDFNFVLGSTDTWAYQQIAQNVFSGNGFSESIDSPFLPFAGRLPFLPLVLGLFGEKYFVFILLQVIVSCLTVVYAYKLSALFFSRNTAFWTSIIAALSPLLAFHSINILTEAWFSFWFILSMYYLAKFWKDTRFSQVALSAFFLGLATLTRATTLIFPFLVILLLFFVIKIEIRKKMLASLLFILTFSAIISPWVIRNYRVFGGVALSSIPPYNLYFYNARVFFQVEKGITNEEAKQIFRDKEQAYRNVNPDANEITMQKFYTEQALSIVKTDKLGYAKFHLINTAAVYLNTGYDDFVKAWIGHYKDINFSSYIFRGYSGMKELVSEHLGFFVGKLMLSMVYLVIVVGLFLNLGNYPRSRYYLWLVLVILFFGLTTGAVAEPRFRVPVEPLIILLFVQAISTVMGYGEKIYQVSDNNGP